MFRTFFFLLFILLLTLDVNAFYEDETDCVALQVNGGKWYCFDEEFLDVISAPEDGFKQGTSEFFLLEEGKSVTLKYKAKNLSSFSVKVNSLAEQSSGIARITVNGKSAVDDSGEELNLVNLVNKKAFEETAPLEINDVQITVPEGTFAFTEILIIPVWEEDSWIDDSHTVKTKVVSPKRGQYFVLDDGVEIKWSIISLKRRNGIYVEDEEDVSYKKGWVRIEKCFEDEEKWTEVPGAQVLDWNQDGFKDRENSFMWKCEEPGNYRFRVVWSYGKSPTKINEEENKLKSELFSLLYAPKKKFFERCKSYSDEDNSWGKYSVFYRSGFRNELYNLTACYNDLEQERHVNYLEIARTCNESDRRFFCGLQGVVNGVCGEKDNQTNVDPIKNCCVNILDYWNLCLQDVKRLKEQYKNNESALEELDKAYPQDSEGRDLHVQLINGFKETLDNYNPNGRPAGTKRTVRINGVDVAFRWIPSGTFRMGADREGERPIHNVSITRGYWLAETETTQSLWTAVMDDNLSEFKGDDLPVGRVTWENCRAFIDKLNRNDEIESFGTFRLPTEAEWEYACRAGNSGDYNVPGEYLSKLGWFRNNSDERINPVYKMLPNAWGLYDMHGNVWEWCSDWWGTYLEGVASDPKGADSGRFRILRGGSSLVDEKGCSSSSRGRSLPTDVSYDYGFRLLLTDSK